MASPQTDDGYTKIANELLEALCAYRLPGEQRQCLDVVFRKTYGWNKKSDAIALSQFVEMTGIKKQNVVRALNGLLSKRLITVIKKDNAPAHIYEITKDYSKWVPLSKKITLSKKIKTVIKKDNLPLSKKSTTKDTTTKDTTTKESSLGEYLLVKIEKENLTIYQDQILEFYKYKNAMPKKDKCDTERKINGIIKNCLLCEKKYADLNECLEITMENGWKTPGPEYLEGKARTIGETIIPEGDPF